jgi:hypothetical protein
MNEEIKINNNTFYHMAFAIIKKLWADGLLTYDEFVRIDKRNKDSFGVCVDDIVSASTL